MLTYPSTNGVFEETSARCAHVHDAGGQVYVDGANLNALVGLARPGTFGADVSHLNLHKTFCIPHGGGGPGVGPVAVRAHLAEFLPATRSSRPPGPATSAGRAAPYGSAGILPISWAYIRMMGAEGPAPRHRGGDPVRELPGPAPGPHFPVLYTGRTGWSPTSASWTCAPITSQTGITAEDVAKRLIDYGFHAPDDVVPGGRHPDGRAHRERGPGRAGPVLRRDDRDQGRRSTRSPTVSSTPKDNPLKNAPHTAGMLLAADWAHPYEREQAAYPVPGDRRAKYWPPVRRIDQAYGDRNLACACPPPSAFES